MPLTLAIAALRRHVPRTVLASLGVAIAAALLLDMVMLATGMQDSFAQFLMVQGFQLRITPKGTLPFDTEATIHDAAAVERALHAIPDILAVSPVLGGQVHVLPTIPPDIRRSPIRESTSLALGINGAVQGDYELLSGTPTSLPDHVVINAVFANTTGAHVGDTLELVTDFSPQLRAYGARRRVVVSGLGRFYYTASAQPVLSMPLPLLQAMGGSSRADQVSLIMAKVRPGANADHVAQQIDQLVPRVSAFSTGAALQQVSDRLSYFRQLAFILGAVSLVVGFLLVTTLVTVSVQERFGEIAILRAIGISRRHVMEQIVIESLVLTVSGAVVGLGIGLVTGHFLDAILSAFPGLPAAFHFFLFRARDAWMTVALLVGAGVLAALYPSWRASAMPIASTLRREAVA